MRLHLYLTFVMLTVCICFIQAVVKSNKNSSKPNTQQKQVYKNVSNEQSTIKKHKVAVKSSKFRPKVSKPNTNAAKMITSAKIKKWADDILNELLEHEETVVRPKEIMKNFSNLKLETRNGSIIVDKTAKILEDLLRKRAVEAENIMRKVEELAKSKSQPPTNYVFDPSKGLNKIKKIIKPEDEYEKPLNCCRLQRVKLTPSSHFDADVSLETSSVHVVAEVFECGEDVIDGLYFTEELLQTFRNNYAQDASLSFQYFCSAKGFLRHYPAASWESMFRLDLNDENLGDVYDCRLRPWYVSASGAPRDILILLDASGSMLNSSNNVIARIFILALLTALTDDDRVNVLRFHEEVFSPINCFEDKLVSANHINTAAMIDALQGFNITNKTQINVALEYAVNLLQKQSGTPDRPASCQQAIILLSDTLYDDFEDLLSELDPEGKIRIFVQWLHDINGLRDNSREYGNTLSCNRDGGFAELVTHADATKRVLEILKVLDRSLVAQRKERLRVYSDLYAHLEDPRRGEYHWVQKENAEQAYRYTELRRNKENLMSDIRLMKDYMHQVSLEQFGHYYEGEDVKYRMQISVSVPVFEYTTVENITIQLNEEKQRNSTRTYPVNRLLGVAGVDIPLDDLKLVLPYFELGPGGTLFLLDHRGSIVLHDNIKPILDGDILKPGYRTVDMLDLEQPAADHRPRHYPTDWMKFRRTIIIDKGKGTTVMEGKNIYDGGMRASLEQREYHWRRVIDHYTAVVVLPPYGRQHAVSESEFTQKLAEDALKALSGTEFSVHPDWLYCRHVHTHFDTRESEVLHFLRRRRDEPHFKMQHLKRHFSPIPPSLLEKTYMCEEKLMARLCHEAIATEQWAREHEEPGVRDCDTCTLGSTTAFFATESGLTRWQQYHSSNGHAEPPDASQWARAPAAPWFRRAAARRGALAVHAPALPARRMRNAHAAPRTVGIRAKWLTAARTVEIPGKGIIGVAGFHFYPTHFMGLLNNTTDFPCQEDSECEAQCDGEIWSCVVIDDEGWVVVFGNPTEEDEKQGDGVRQHLSTLYPVAMAALLNASVFKLHWLHDYQAVCFPTEEESVQGAAPTFSSMIKTVAHAVNFIVQIASNTFSVLAALSTTSLVQADTQLETEKRRYRIKKDFEREKFETLYDKRVLVNRTKITACDRSRPIYEFQRTQEAAAALSREASPCSWPLVAAPLEQTNLILVAVYLLCPYEGRPIPNPLINQLVDMNGETENNVASQLACWRNRVTLPGRPPATKCFPHNYTAEVGYRQCGPWLPDPDIAYLQSPSKLLIICLLLFIFNHINFAQNLH